VTVLGTLEVIAPGYRVMEAVPRVGQHVLAQQQAPADLSELARRVALTNASALGRIPQELESLTRELLHGDFRARVSLLSEPEDILIAKSMLNRLVLGVVSSALALASALLLASGSAPTLAGVRVVNMLGGIGLFFSVLLILGLVVQSLRDRA
jgi:ubiquinone biosynthesis protein